MDPLSWWFIAYALPMLAAGIAVKVLPRRPARLSIRNGIIIHGALIVSIVATQYFIHASGLEFPWHPKSSSITLYLTGMLVAAVLIRSAGIWYAFSALLQELAIASITFLLLPALPVYLIVLLVVPIFVFDHTLRAKRWYLRLALFTIWGVISVLAFARILDVYLLAAAHTLLGAMLISRSVILYTADKRTKPLVN